MIAFDVGFLEPNADDAIVAESLNRFRKLSPEELRAGGASPNPRAVVSPAVGPQESGRVEPGQLPFFNRIQAPVPAYLAVTDVLGHAVTIPDKDGTLRVDPLFVRLGTRDVPALPLAAAAAFTNSVGDVNALSQPTYKLVTAPFSSSRGQGFTIDADGNGLAALRRLIPVESSTQMIISYAGPPSRLGSDGQTFNIVSFVDVMEGKVKPSVFKDKMVFIGLLGASGFADDYWTPTSQGVGKMAGVEIHANAFATLVSAKFFTDQQFPVTAALVVVFSLFTGFSAARLRIVLSALVTLLIGLVYFLGSLKYADSLFDPAGVAIPNLVFPPLALLAAFLSVIVYRVVFEQAEARATRGAMGKYLSPAILAEVLKDPDQLKLGGERWVMTALFTDIRGFTSISESLEPQALVKILNEYLSAMTDIVHEQEGVLDKYMGDAIMAWWGAPTDQPDHAYRAAVTGILMRAKLRELHKMWADRNEPENVSTMEMGVGVNTGPMVYGNTGSHDRFDFTVLGDAVNLASRLEGANKEYGSNVIISQSTLDQMEKDQLVTRFMDFIAVKGKTEPISIYELISTPEGVAPYIPQVLTVWNKAMDLYKNRSFEEAARAFEEVLEINPNDRTAQVYLERCRDLADAPPPADWDGVFVMTHK
ncbi:MAG: CHASE2 domain-containing protein [Chloroflexi bacterium]|nr:CHASE2 domain-containing protein [Chloroflexota bacterium]